MKLLECTLCGQRDSTDDTWHAIPDNVAVYVCDPCWQKYGGDEQAIGEALRRVLSVGF
jgi:hypothetical protein